MAEMPAINHLWLDIQFINNENDNVAKHRSQLTRM
jgi:hypothetical protein